MPTAKCQHHLCDNDIPIQRIKNCKKVGKEPKYCSGKCSVKGWKFERFGKTVYNTCPSCGGQKSRRKRECTVCRRKSSPKRHDTEYYIKQIRDMDFEERLSDPESLFHSCDIIKKVMEE